MPEKTTDRSVLLARVERYSKDIRTIARIYDLLP